MKVEISESNKSDCVKAIIKINSYANKQENESSLTYIIDKMIRDIVKTLEDNPSQKVTYIATYGFYIVGMIFPSEPDIITIECFIDPNLIVHPI